MKKKTLKYRAEESFKEKVRVTRRSCIWYGML